MRLGCRKGGQPNIRLHRDAKTHKPQGPKAAEMQRNAVVLQGSNMHLVWGGGIGAVTGQNVCLTVRLPHRLQNRLAYLTNKCFGDGDLEYYIAEAGHILGVRVGENCGARHVLAEVRGPAPSKGIDGVLGRMDALTVIPEQPRHDGLLSYSIVHARVLM